MCQLFDCDFRSATVSIAIATHVELRDLALQAGRRLGLDDSSVCCSIQAKPTALQPFI
jgi:hypothetical protein